ncbi:MAG: hypothetical protein JW987_12265 [Anaerolineaceae bacterium]|nr:hypothetical protein [Anaerolineaceae bacterium]
MREFKALNPIDLPGGFDLEVHTEEPVVEVKESKGKIVINYVFPGFYLVDDNRKVAGEQLELKQLYITSTGFLSESGKPLLPSFGRYVQIPQNCDFKIRVKKTQPVKFDDVLVSPAQTLLSDNPNQKHEYEFDQEFYAKDELYPDEICKVTGPFTIDQYRALLVHITPLQYNAAKKQLIGYGNITVTINLKEKPDQEERITDSLVENEAFGNLMLNPGLKVAERVGVKIPPVIVPFTGPQLLIIYAKIFEKSAKKLADWKNHRGLLTETVCVDDIGNSVDRLKAYIRGKRSPFYSRLRYVLLLGDSDMIATQTNFNCIYGCTFRDDLQTATDYYYSTQTDFDPAHPNDKLIFPWLSIGRIPVRPDLEGPPASGDSQAQLVVDQIIAYEKKPPADPGFYKRMVFAAYFQGNNHTDTRGYLSTIENIRSQMEALGYSTERVYVTNDTTTPLYYKDGTQIPAAVISAFVNDATATQMLINATTEGQLYIGHRDHGNWDGWVHPRFRNSDLDHVTGDMPSIYYSINCETGGLDYPAPIECFAEKNLRMKGTASSLIAATRDSGTYLNNDLVMAIFDATFGGVLPTFPGGNASYPVRNNRLGDILNYGKFYLPVANTDIRSVRDHFEIYHVIGDPTLELWTHMPLRVAMNVKIVRKNLDIQFLLGCPSGAVVTIWYGARMLKRLEPTSNHITIPLTNLVPFPLPKPSPTLKVLQVCFWAPGYQYTEVKLIIPTLSPPIIPPVPVNPSLEPVS